MERLRAELDPLIGERDGRAGDFAGETVGALAGDFGALAGGFGALAGRFEALAGRFGVLGGSLIHSSTPARAGTPSPEYVVDSRASATSPAAPASNSAAASWSSLLPTCLAGPHREQREPLVGAEPGCDQVADESSSPGAGALISATARHPGRVERAVAAAAARVPVSAHQAPGRVARRGGQRDLEPVAVQPPLPVWPR